MRIAQVAPLHEAVPPRLYGGTERVVSYLTEALVALGHQVTLFASGDSQTSATLVPCCERALRLQGPGLDPNAFHLWQLDRVWRSRGDFDVLHFHGDLLHYPLARCCDTASLTTLHGRLDQPGYAALHRLFTDLPLASISLAQRQPLPDLNWRGTVPHGLPPALLAPGRGDGGYLAFLGRISPEKGVDRAIGIARRAGLPLKIAAKVAPVDRPYFETLRPLFNSPLVEFVGEIGEAEKSRFLGAALALLFPIAWPEPFGLVMVEAMACGTPVLAFRHGSVSEVVEDGVTGIIVESLDQAVAAMPDLLALDRRRCREAFERRFTVETMARAYLHLYRALSPPVARTALDPVE